MDVSTTTKAVTLPDETWALIERFAAYANSPLDNMITRLAREGAQALAERHPHTFGKALGK